MPINLTTPANGGVIVDGETFAQAKIVHFEHDVASKRIQLLIRYGNDNGEGAFVQGHPSLRKTITIIDDDYADLVANAVATDGENVYQAVKRCTYEWLIANGHFAGTIV